MMRGRIGSRSSCGVWQAPEREVSTECQGRCAGCCSVNARPSLIGTGRCSGVVTAVPRVPGGCLNEAEVFEGPTGCDRTGCGCRDRKPSPAELSRGGHGKPEPAVGIEPCLKRLADAGPRVGVPATGGPTARDWLADKADLTHPLPPVVSVDEREQWKPSREPFVHGSRRVRSVRSPWRWCRSVQMAPAEEFTLTRPVRGSTSGVGTLQPTASSRRPPGGALATSTGQHSDIPNDGESAEIRSRFTGLPGSESRDGRWLHG